MFRIIWNYWGKNKLHVISKKMKLPMEQVIEACDHIKELNPKPGSGFDARGHLKYITPDVTVVKLSNYYEILLNEYTYPKIGINHFYKQFWKQNLQRKLRIISSERYVRLNGYRIVSGREIPL